MYVWKQADVIYKIRKAGKQVFIYNYNVNYLYNWEQISSVHADTYKGFAPNIKNIENFDVFCELNIKGK